MSNKLIWLDDAIAAVQSSPFPIQALAAIPAVSAGVTPEVAALMEAAEKAITARNRYEATPTDRGGEWGPKGRTNNEWRIAFAGLAGLAAALAEIKGESHE